MHDIVTLRHRIDGNSKTTAQRWGTKFHSRVIKHFLATWVEVYYIALVTDNRFIKESHKTFTKYQSASPLEIEFFVKQIDNIKSVVDEYLTPGHCQLKVHPLLKQTCLRRWREASDRQNLQVV